MKREDILQGIPATHVAPRPRPRAGEFLRATVLSPLVCSLLASLGIFGGIASGFVGFICIVVHAALPGDTVFDKVGTALMIATIPAMLIGSIFVDEIEPKKS